MKRILQLTVFLIGSQLFGQPNSGVFKSEETCNYLFINFNSNYSELIETDMKSNENFTYRISSGWKFGETPIKYAFGVKTNAAGKDYLLRYFTDFNTLKVRLKNGDYRIYKRINKHSTITSSDKSLEKNCINLASLPNSGVFKSTDNCDYLFYEFDDNGNTIVEIDMYSNKVNKFSKAKGNWTNGNGVKIKFAYGVTQDEQGKDKLLRYFKTDDLISVRMKNGNYRTYKRVNNHKSQTDRDELLEYACYRKANFPFYPYSQGFNSERINGKSWRFEAVGIKISWNGLITVDGWQTTNRCEGFTGKIVLDLIDFNDNTMARVELDRQGVDPDWYIDGCYGEKKYNKTFQLDIKNHPYLITELKTVRAQGVRDGKGRDIQFYSSSIKQITDDLKESGKNVAELYALMSGG